MSLTPATQTPVNLTFFNPYAGLGPPACCYCAPTAVPVQNNFTNIVNVTQQAAAIQAQQQAIQVEVNANINATIPGLSSLAFMTTTEASMRTLARGRIEAEQKHLMVTPGTAEMGAGPYFYNNPVFKL